MQFESPLEFAVSNEAFTPGAKRTSKPVPEQISKAAEISVKESKPITGDFSKKDSDNVRRLVKKYVNQKYGVKKVVKTYTTVIGEGRVRLTFQVIDA